MTVSSYKAKYKKFSTAIQTYILFFAKGLLVGNIAHLYIL